ncbi:hypothetical protein Mapa_003140 [Marchantia paleacea]|nr:hypothetical protein Mapa_003140 [Marchantia paleacea]
MGPCRDGPSSARSTVKRACRTGRCSPVYVLRSAAASEAIGERIVRSDDGGDSGMKINGESGALSPSTSQGDQMSSVKLVMSWCSPMAHQVAISLRHKRVKFTLIDEKVLNRNPRTLNANPLYKMVPILIHTRRLVQDPLIIMEYIDDALSKELVQLLPSDPFERCAARYWSGYIQTKVIATVLKCVDQDDGRLTECLFDTFTRLDKILSIVAPECCFFMGDELGFVDIVFAPIIPWLQALEHLDGIRLPTPLECPHLHKWFDALKRHPSVRPSLQICSPERLEVFISQTLRNQLVGQ